MAYDRGLADRVRSILERRAGFSERQSMMFVDAMGSDSDEALHEWVESALAFVLTLPPKKLPMRKPVRVSRLGGPA